MPTFNEWLNGRWDINDVKCEDNIWSPKTIVALIILSIFIRFYEYCQNKSENFCVTCFNRLADYCKE